MTKYHILSPDGFSIDPSKTFTQKEIPAALKKFKERYTFQGYYSSVDYGKIPLNELDQYCTIQAINEQDLV